MPVEQTNTQEQRTCRESRHQQTDHEKASQTINCNLSRSKVGIRNNLGHFLDLFLGKTKQTRTGVMWSLHLPCHLNAVLLKSAIISDVI
jgi:hypothetical protein